MLLFDLLFLHILFWGGYGTFQSKQMWAPLPHFKKTNIACLQVSALRRHPQDKLKASPSLSSSYQLFRQSQGSSMVLCNVLCQLGDTKLFQTTMRHKFWKSLFLLRASVSLTHCLQVSSIKGDCSQWCLLPLAPDSRNWVHVCRCLSACFGCCDDDWGREMSSPKGTRVQATWDRVGVCCDVLIILQKQVERKFIGKRWLIWTKTWLKALQVYFSYIYQRWVSYYPTCRRAQETQSLPQGIYDPGRKEPKQQLKYIKQNMTRSWHHKT